MRITEKLPFRRRDKVLIKERIVLFKNKDRIENKIDSFKRLQHRKGTGFEVHNRQRREVVAEYEHYKTQYQRCPSHGASERSD